jgi:hypothetical protein
VVEAVKRTYAGLTGSALRESIGASQRTRAALVEQFGCLPTSILRLSRNALSREVYHLQGETPQRQARNDPSCLRKTDVLTSIGYSGAKNNPSRKMNGRGSAGVSTMPPELVAFFVRFYARAGQTYLDPFVGQGIRMQVAKRFGLHYRGMDCSRAFVRFVDAVRKKIDDGTTTIDVTCGDSREPTTVPNDCGDFSFYSPPYWDIEYYGPERAQLGTGRSYRDFLDGLGAVARAWLPKFKRGAWHVVNVGDFRKGGVFYPYHADVIATYRAAGWALHDVWVIEGLVTGMARVFAVSFTEQRIAPRVHEYALVFQRPR